MKNNYKKIIFNYKIEDIIKANLNLQSTQRILKDDYKINLISFDSVIKASKNYKLWGHERQDQFLKLIGGAANLIKTKKYIEERLEQNEH